MTNASGRKYFRRIPTNAAGESDIHAICDAWDTPHGLAHAVKKILCAGMRGGKSREQDLREAIHAIERELEFNAAHESHQAAARAEEQMDHA